MNNIEIKALKSDLKKYMKFTDEQVNCLNSFSEAKLVKLKRNITKMKNDEYLKNKPNIRRKIETVLGQNSDEPMKRKILTKKPENRVEIKKRKIDIPNSPKPLEKRAEIKKQKNKEKAKKPEFKYNEGKKQHVEVVNRKPRIVFITDVKGWAWWIKSEYLKKYLSEYYDIDIVNIIQDNNCMQYGIVNQSKYDLYFSFGFSYVSFLTKVPKKKKVCGVTAHRTRNVIFPKMKQVEWHHANSILLLKEMRDMGFQRTHYIPNGVDEELFKPINPINPKTELICGHVGKECHAKNQKTIILPAIKSTGCKSATNMRTWKDKLPHNQMPKIYNEMDLFLVSSSEDGTPNPAHEAAACGRPIISNKIGNMPEFIKDGENGFIVPKKINAYIDKINYFKQHPKELVRMGNNARKTIEEAWTWKLMSRNYLKMFDTIFNIKRDSSKYENPALEHLKKL